MLLLVLLLPLFLSGKPCTGFGGGQHLSRAGRALQEAAQVWQGEGKAAGPRILADAGQALVDLAEGWSTGNDEVVAYAAQDAADCFMALAHITQRVAPDQQQRIYRTAAGAMRDVSLQGMDCSSQTWQALLDSLQEAAAVSHTDPAFGMSLQSAVQSLTALTEDDPK